MQGAFEKSYREKFARTPPQVAIEFINIRVSAFAAVADAAAVAQSSLAGGGARGGRVRGQRPVYFPEAGDYVTTTVYDRSTLAAGTLIAGPAVVEEAGSTLVLAPGASAAVVANGNIVVTVG